MAPRVFLLLASVAAVSGAAPMRQEKDPRFPLDEPFLADGGVQFFYELAPKLSLPDSSSAAFTLFRPLEATNRWKTAGPLHVVMSRLVYEVDKDASFFTEARANDLSYINTVAKEYRISRDADGGFRSDAMPSNTFFIRFYDEAALRREEGRGALARFLALVAVPSPVSVVFQQNDNFARVMGARTGELGITWTAHYALRPGRTRLQVCTMSYLHTLPPFFLGGDQRVYRESVDGASALIDALRRYRDPP